MSQILLLLEHRENRRLLSQWLATRYEVVAPELEADGADRCYLLQSQPFDLCILDARALNQCWESVKARRDAEQPVLLLFVLVTARQDVRLITRDLWQSIDDLITKPIEKLELQARVEILLRSRQNSIQLQIANLELQQQIDARQRTEAKLQNALEKERELNELKSRFVSMVSHEFRNPLNLISGVAQLLERKSDKLSAQKKQEFLQRHQAAVKKLLDLLDEILNIGRAESGKVAFNPTLINLEKFCRQIAMEMQVSTGEKHTIVFVSESDCPLANVDEKLLQQILTNLLSNAIKYSPQGGKVYLELGSMDGSAVIRVKDNGIGIPLENQPRLFESFHRASNVGSIPGTGLGLVIVKKYVDLHQGAIAIESEVGVGTKFTLTLPLNN